MDTNVDARQQRAMALVASKRSRIKHVAGSRWLVPSQSNASGGYVVDADAKTCSCPDHEDRGVRCKHLIAVAIIRQEISFPDGTTVTTEARITYAQNWPAYNRAQAEERSRVQLLLRGLCDGIVQAPRQGRGRKPALVADVVYAATMKIYGTMSGRRSTSDIRACADQGLVEKAPAYNTLFKHAERPELASLLKTLVQEAALPLKAIETAFAVDSTGFATNTYSRWFDEKYGGEKKCQRWVKAHAMVGTMTNAITAIEVTESNVGDAPMLTPLVESTVAAGFDVREVSADKAYLSNEMLTTIESVGAIPYIPFKSNSRGTGGSDAWRRLWHTFEARNEEFLAHYHKRSNVESTFSMVKRKFGPSVRAKTPAAQINEVLLKALCHNLACVVHAIHEVGIEPRFWERLAVGGAH